MLSKLNDGSLDQAHGEIPVVLLSSLHVYKNCTRRSLNESMVTFLHLLCNVKWLSFWSVVANALDIVKRPKAVESAALAAGQSVEIATAKMWTKRFVDLSPLQVLSISVTFLHRFQWRCHPVLQSIHGTPEEWQLPTISKGIKTVCSWGWSVYSFSADCHVVALWPTSNKFAQNLPQPRGILRMSMWIIQSYTQTRVQLVKWSVFSHFFEQMDMSTFFCSKWCHSPSS